MQKKELNITHGSKDWRAQELSSFADAVFSIDSVQFYSIEGFINSIKFPYYDRRHVVAMRCHGIDAKILGKDAGRKYVWWYGERFRYGSKRHHTLIGRAIRKRFRDSQRAQIALAATAGLTLVHKPKRSEPRCSIRGAEYCTILTELRERLIATGQLKELKPR